MLDKLKELIDKALGNDKRHPVEGALLASAGGAASTGLSVLTAIPALVAISGKDKSTIANGEQMEALKKVWDKLGVTYEGTTLASLLNGPHFNPSTNSIHSTVDDLGILAHETGHAKNFNDVAKLGKLAQKLHMASYGAGRVGTAAGTIAASLAAAVGADDDTVRNIGLLGSGSSVPMLAEETLASIRGAKLLNAIKGVPFKGKLKAFVGLPTYLSAAAAPMAPWAAFKTYDAIKD
jgi:hypothetical protein